MSEEVNDYDAADEIELLLEIRELASQITSSMPVSGKDMVGKKIKQLIDDYLELSDDTDAGR